MSRAIISPVIVTSSAEIFREVGIVIICGFMGRELSIINRPPEMAPQAKRFIGSIISLLFSLMGVRGMIRGLFIDEKKMIRRL